MWDRLTAISSNATSVLDLDTVKLHLSEVSDDFDDLIQTYMDAATAYVDGPSGIGVSLLTTQYRYSLDCWRSSFYLPIGPVQSVESVEWRSTDNVWNTVDPGVYYVDLDSKPGRVTLNYNNFWPNVILAQGSPIRINFTTGYGDTGDFVPRDLKQAMMLLVANWYANREGVVGVGSRDSPEELPMGISAVLNRYRTFLIG